MGVTLVPRLSVPELKPVHKRSGGWHDSPVRYLPIVDPAGGKPPTRRVVLAWRRSYTRYEAIAAVRNAIYACPLPGVTRLS
jgi:LysR family hydrogen peroxide-inducible transcriptional activator